MILKCCLDSLLGSSISPGSLADGAGHPPPSLTCFHVRGFRVSACNLPTLLGAHSS